MFNIRDYVKLKDTDSIGIIKKIIQKNTDEIYIIEINKKKVSTSKDNLILSSKEELENTNSRYIKNKTVTAAIERACEQKLAINKIIASIKKFI